MIISNGVTYGVLEQRFRAGNEAQSIKSGCFGHAGTYIDHCQLKADDRNFLILIDCAMLQVTPFEKESYI